PGGEVEGTDRLPQRAGGPAVGDGDIPLDERRHAVPAGPGGDVLAQRVEAVDGPGGGLELVEHELRVAQDHLGGIDGQLLLGVAAGGVVEDVAAAGGQYHRVEAGAGQGGEVRPDGLEVDRDRFDALQALLEEVGDLGAEVEHGLRPVLETEHLPEQGE